MEVVNISREEKNTEVAPGHELNMNKQKACNFFFFLRKLPSWKSLFHRLHEVSDAHMESPSR